MDFHPLFPPVEWISTIDPELALWHDKTADTAMTIFLPVGLISLVLTLFFRSLYMDRPGSLRHFKPYVIFFGDFAKFSFLLFLVSIVFGFFGLIIVFVYRIQSLNSFQRSIRR